MLAEQSIDCPCCGEPLTIVVDASAGNQDYVEDCSVCCQPMDVRVEADGDAVISVSATPSH